MAPPNPPPAAPTAAAAPRLPYDPTAPFPSGQDQPGFVPPGAPGTASAAQGNVAGVPHALKRRLVLAERDARPPLGFAAIAAKYARWGVGASALRGIDRNARLPREQRARVVVWTLQAVQALRAGVSMHTSPGGQIAWARVKEHIFRASGKNIGMLQAKAKWEQLQHMSTHSMKILDTVQPLVQQRQQRAAKAEQDGDKDEEHPQEEEDDK